MSKIKICSAGTKMEFDISVPIHFSAVIPSIRRWLFVGIWFERESMSILRVLLLEPGCRNRADQHSVLTPRWPFSIYPIDMYSIRMVKCKCSFILSGNFQGPMVAMASTNVMLYGSLYIYIYVYIVISYSDLDTDSLRPWWTDVGPTGVISAQLNLNIDAI